MVFDFVKKEKLNEKDVGFNEDAINVLCNLIHIEWHSLKSYFSTSDEDWLRINEEARKDRTELMDYIIKESEGDLWCFSKHDLNIILGYIELANRKYSIGEKEEAIKYLDKSKKWLGLFMVKNKL
jgi:hypothetical protein